MALREVAALEAKWDPQRPWTTAQEHDRALVHFAALVISPMSGAKTDADRERALRVAQRHLDVHANDAATSPLLIGMARGAFALGKLERAAALLERAVARTDGSRGIALVGLAEVYERLARPDLSMSTLQTATKVDPVNTATHVMDADNTSNIAHRRLGRILELRREWKEALITYKQWRPSSWCGNEWMAFDNEREAGIARARLQLGDAAALAGYEKRLADWPSDTVGIGPLLQFVELAAAGRDLTRAAAAVQAAFRSAQHEPWVDEVKRAVDLLSAVLSASGKSLLDVVRAQLRRSRFDSEPAEAAIVGRMLPSFDPSAVKEMPSLIQAGDRAAIAVAGYVPNIAVKQALTQRLGIEKDAKARESLDRAVRALDYLSVGHGNRPGHQDVLPGWCDDLHHERTDEQGRRAGGGVNSRLAGLRIRFPNRI